MQSEGQEWLRHRRVANPVFNERSNKMVWDVSVEQALDLLSHWNLTSTNQTTSINTMGHDFMSIALHVISAIGFGIPMFFSTDKTASLPRPPFTNRTPEKGYSYTFAEALHFISFNITIHAAMMGGMLPAWIPKSLLAVYKKHKAVHHDFSRYLQSMIKGAQESLTMSSTASSSSRTSETRDYMTHNLLNVMVANSVNQAAGGNGKNKPLTPEELSGDVFVFMLAGHETTAQALNYAFLAMALEDDLQDWIAGKMNEETKDLPKDPREWSYEETYEKLNAAKYLMVCVNQTATK